MYFSASNITSPKLDADCVILSGRNTAVGARQEAGDTPRISGPKREFYYTQAGALLGYCQEFDAGATVKLRTFAVGAITQGEAVSRTEALRRSTPAMTETCKPPATNSP